jgi:hypothetical protein
MHVDEGGPGISFPSRAARNVQATVAEWRSEETFVTRDETALCDHRGQTSMMGAKAGECFEKMVGVASPN